MKERDCFHVEMGLEAVSGSHLMKTSPVRSGFKVEGRGQGTPHRGVGLLGELVPF